MPRIPVVDRTLTTTVADVLCMDLVNEQPVFRTFRISRTYKKDRDLIKAIQACINDDSIKVVNVKSKYVEKVRCTMPEQKYLDNATIKEIIKEEENNE